jgi:AcrR family transcriptional regulator
MSMGSANRQIRTFSEDEGLVRERRRHIADCAIKVFLQKGYDQATMADIARASGVSKGLLYHYVSSREDILYLIARDQSEGTSAGFSALAQRCEAVAPTEAVVEYVRYYYSVVNDTQDYQVFLNQVVAKLPREDRRVLFESNNFALDVLDGILKRGVASGEFEVEDTTLAAHNIMLIGRSWADRRWFLGRRYSFDEYLDVQTRAILKAIHPLRAAGAEGRGEGTQ